MAAFDFPTSPTDGQLYTLNDRTYRYNAAKQRWDGFTVNGAQGIQGITGEQGVQGLVGEQGTQGIQGTGGAGEQGIQGTAGAQGIQGTGGDGNQGAQGIQGIAGATAAQGIQGTTGAQGIQGSGGDGNQGVQGIQGTGGAGSQGIQGIQGIAGSQGIQGADGAGSQGIQGIQGITGPAGLNTVPSSGVETTSYTLQIGDVGEFVTIGVGGGITIPSGVFSTGDVITVYNDTSGDRTITSSAVTSYLSGINTNVSSFTVPTRGLFTILFVGTNTCVVSGVVS